MTVPIQRASILKTLWLRCVILSVAIHATGFILFLQLRPYFTKAKWPSIFASSKPHPTFIAAHPEAQEGTNAADALLAEAFEELIIPMAPDAPFESSWEALSAHLSPTTETSHWPITHSTQDSPELLSVSCTPSTKASPTLVQHREDAPLALLDRTSEMLALTCTDIIHKTLTLEAPPIAIENFVQENQSAPATVPLLATTTHYPSYEPIEKMNLLHMHTEAASILLPLKARPIAQSQVPLFVMPPTSSLTHVSGAPVAVAVQGISYAMASKINIEELLPEQLISSVQWNAAFETKISVFPDKQGYVFSIALLPSSDLSAERMAQNFYFFIDASSNIEKHKLAVYKRSVLRALSALESGDSFNIFLLDKTISKLSPHNLAYSLKSLHAAEEFLEKAHDRSLFSSFHLSECLADIAKEVENDGEVHTAILLTNGNSNSPIHTQQKAIAKYLDSNSGKLSLYTAAVGQNNNFVYMDMISALSGGKMLYSETNASFPRKLTTFIKALHSPLVKDVMLTLQASDPQANLSLLPIAAQLPNVYNNEPFLIMGKIDRLCDLSLTLQGKHETNWVYINKTVRFEEGVSSDASMKKTWKMREATICYDRFLKEPKAKHLKDAREILESAYGKTLQ